MSFQQLINILWSRKWIAVVSLLITVATTLVVSLLLPKQYIATVSLVVDQRGVDPLTGGTLPVQLLPGYMATQVDVIASQNVARRVVKDLKLYQNKQLQKGFEKTNSKADINDWIANLLLNNLEIVPSRESSLIKISYTSIDPKFAAIIANAFAKAFLDTNVELRAQPARQNAEWFEKQIEFLRKRVEESQSALSSYQQKYGIVAVDDKLDLETTRLSDLSKQLLESQGKTGELQSRKDQLKELLARGESIESLQEVISNSFIQSLKSQLAIAQARFAELSKRVGVNHPQYKQAQAEVSSIKQKIRAEVKTVLDSMSSSLASSKQRDTLLKNALSEQKERVLDLKKQRDEIAVLSREVENAQHAYDTALQRSIQTRMESEISQSNIAVLNPATTPEKPSKPKVLLNLILSVFLGGMLGVGAALIMELMDRRVRSSFDISEALEMPVFAVLSYKH